MTPGVIKHDSKTEMLRSIFVTRPKAKGAEGLAMLLSEDLDHGLRHLDFALPTLFLTASLIGYCWRCGRRRANQRRGTNTDQSQTSSRTPLGHQNLRSEALCIQLCDWAVR